MGFTDDQLNELTGRNFQGLPSHRKAIAEQLVNGPLNDDYDMLAQTIAEVRAASPATTTALQNTLAGIVHQAYRKPYDAFVEQYNQSPEVQFRPAPTMPEFYAKNPELEQQVLHTPVQDTLSMLATTTIPQGFSQAGQPFYKVFPRAFNAENVRGVMGYLATTELPSVFQQVTRPIKDQHGRVVYRAADPEQIRPEWLAGVERAYDTMPFFDPSKGGNFAVNWSAQAAKGIRDYREDQRTNRAMSTPMSFLERPNDEGESNAPGYVIDPETGEWSHDNSMAGAEGLATHQEGRSAGFVDQSNYEQRSAAPEGNWGNYVTDLQARFRGQDLKGESRVYNVAEQRMYYAPPGTQNVSPINVDPKSNFAQAGGQGGDVIRSLMRLLKDPNLDQYVAALENGTPVSMNVDRYVNGQLTQVPLSFNSQYQAPGDFREPNWVERLADQIDPDYRGNAVVHVTGTWAVENGTTVYKQPKKFPTSPIGATTQIPSFLWTNDENAAQGMALRTKKNGETYWELPSLSLNGNKPGYDTNVHLTAPAVKAFGQLYETWGKAWQYYKDSYDTAWNDADRATLDYAHEYQKEHMRLPKDWNYETAVQAEFEKRLPADVPRPGTDQYKMWRNGEWMLTELRDIEKQYNGSIPLEAPEMSIEAFDALASSLNTTVATELYNRKFDSGAYIKAQKDLSSAGMYLVQERKARAAGLAAKLNPDIKGTLEYPAPPGMADGAPANGSGGAPLGIAQYRADRANTITMQNAAEIGIGHVGPGAGSPLGGTIVPQTLPQPKLYTLLPDPREGGTPRPDMLSAAGAAMMNRRDLQNSWRFEPGSMKEDDWSWPRRGLTDTWLDERGGETVPVYNRRTRQAMSFRDAYVPAENTYDNSLIGGNPDELADQTDEAGNIVGPLKVASGKGARQIESTQALGKQPYVTPGRVWAMAPGDLHGPGIDEVNENPVDPYIRMGQENTPKAERLDEAEENSEAAADYSEEQRLQRSMRLIPNADNPTTDLPSQIAADVAAHGAYRKGGWAEFFEMRNRDNPLNSASYQALKEDTLEAKGQELRANMQTMSRLGKEDPNAKAMFMRTRLGEDPATWRALNRGKSLPRGEHYRETLLMLAKERGLDLDLGIGKEARLFDQVAALAASQNPEDQLSYQAIQGAFATPGQQILASRGWMGELGRVSGAGMSQPTPAPRGTGRDVHEAARAKYGQLRLDKKKQAAERTVAARQAAGLPISDDPQSLPDALDPTVGSGPMGALPEAPPDPEGYRPATVRDPSEPPEVPPDPEGWSATPPPSRGASHANVAPRGRSLAKWSANDIQGMRGPRGLSTDPITGEFNPLAMDNTAMPARNMRAADPAGVPPAGEPPEVLPDPADWSATPPPNQAPRPRQLNKDQRIIYYPHTDAHDMGKQVGWFMDEAYEQMNRKMFMFIVPKNANDQYLANLHSDAADNFSAYGMTFTPFEELDDPNLPEDYRKIGGYVDPLPPPGSNGNGNGNGAGGNGNGNGGQPPVNTSTPDPNPRPRKPVRPRRVTSLEDDAPGRKPENWPTTPGGAGWMAQWKWDGKPHKAYSVSDGNGGFVWAEDTENGAQVMAQGPAFGRITDDKGSLTNQITYDEAQRYAFEQKVKTQGLNTPAPAQQAAPKQKPQHITRLEDSDPGRNPANWPATPPAVGSKMEFTRGRENWTAYGEEVNGQLTWVLDDPKNGPQVLRENPGYGRVSDPQGNLTNFVSSQEAHDYAYQQRKAALGIAGADPNSPTAQGQGPNTDAANWPTQLQAGWTLETRDYGKSLIYHAQDDAENPGTLAWFSNIGGNLVRRKDLGYGTIRDGNDQVIHQVSQLSHEREAIKTAKQREPTPQPQSTNPANNRTKHTAQGPNGPDLLNLDAQVPGYSPEYNAFARKLGGPFARDFIQKHMEMQFGENTETRANDPAIPELNTDVAYKRAYYAYAQTVDKAWEHLGTSVDDFSTDEAATYLKEEFYVEDNEAELDENGVPTSGPLRAAALLAKEKRRSVGGRFSEKTRLNRTTGGKYSPSAEGTTIDEVMASRRQNATWMANALAIAERDYTTGNVYGTKRVGMLGHIAQTELGADGLFSANMEDLDRTTGEMVPTATHAEMEQGMGIALTAFTRGGSGSLPNTSNEAIATMKSRVQKTFYGIIEEMTKQLEKEAGLDPTEAKSRMQRIKDLALEPLKYLEDLGAKGIQATMGEADNNIVNSIQYGSTRPHSRDKAREIVDKSQAIKNKLQGKSLDDIMGSNEDFFVTDEEGNKYNLGGIREGGSSAGNYGSRGPRGRADIWGRNGRGAAMGSALYGMYMLGREWKMAVGEPIAQAEHYAQTVGQFAPQALGGVDAITSGDAGAIVRSQLTEYYNGQAANEVFGGFNNVAYMYAGMGRTPARVGTELRAVGGVAAGTFMGMNMLGYSLGEAGAAFGAAAAPVALGIGAGLLGVTGIMEATNAIVKPPEGQELTFGKVWQDANTALSLFGASGRMFADKSGIPILGNIMGWGAMAGNKLSGGGYSQDELNALKPYMTEAEWDVVNDKGTPEPVRKMFDKATHVMRVSGESEQSVLQGFGYMQKAFGQLTDEDYALAETVSKYATENGLNLSTLVSSGMQYAENMGAEIGTDDYESLVRDYMRDTNKGSQAQKTAKAGRLAQLSAQWQSTMAPDINRLLANNLSQKYGFDTQTEQSAAVQMTNALQSNGATLSEQDLNRVGRAVNLTGTYQSNVFAGAVGGLVSLGSMTTNQGMDLMEQLSGAGMSSQEASIFSRMLGGDMKAMSFQAWQSGKMQNAFFDRAGNAIAQYNGSTTMGVYNAWAPKVGLPMMTTSQFLGTNNSEILNAWNTPGGNGGFWGLQQLAMDKSYAASMASSGIALKGIELQENFYWGKNQGGTWDNPARHSSWGIEDVRIANQDASQRANFADQWQRMTMQNDFSVRREDNAWQRMMTSQQYQNYQWAYSYNQFQQQQVWTQQDYQYQDTMRGLQFGWNMEDLNEQIRFSSGRQRRQFVKQRDRAAQTENLEEDQISTTRDRQKELWAQQEEQFQKQKQYNAELQRLDVESFQMNKDQREAFYKLDVDAYDRRVKEYEEEKKLQDELRELQRKFQYDQLQLSKDSAGAQAAAAAAQYEINKAIAEGQKNWQQLTGTIEQLNNYDNAFRTSVAITEMAKMMDRLDTVRLDKLIKLVQTIGTTNPGTRWGGARDE